MPETSDYTPAWAERRRRRWGLVAAMLALPGWPFLASRVNDALGLAPEQGFAFLLPVLGFATVIALSVRYHAFPCPRCQRPYFWNGLFANSFTSRCLHCGLKAGQAS